MANKIFIIAAFFAAFALLFGCAAQQGGASAPGTGSPGTGGQPSVPPAGGIDGSVGGQQTGGEVSPPADTASVQSDLDSYDSGIEESIAEVGEAG